MTHPDRHRRLVILAALVWVGGCDYTFNLAGPTVTNTNTNTNSATNSNVFDLHDLVNFNATTPGGTGDGTGTGTGSGGSETNPLGIPPGARMVAQAVADANPALIATSCQDVSGELAWQFMDRVVASLRAADPRWGYVCRTPDCLLISKDVIGYRATADNTGLWGVDVIGNHCSAGPSFTWNVIGFDGQLVWKASRQ